MQLHPALRNHNESLYARFGPDMGADIRWRPNTRNLQTLLNLFGNNPDFTLILFTVDETTFSRACPAGRPLPRHQAWPAVVVLRQLERYDPLPPGRKPPASITQPASTTTPALTSPSRLDTIWRPVRELAGESGGAQRDRHGGCRRDGACRSLRSRQEGLQAGLNGDTTPNRLLRATAISDHTVRGRRLPESE